VKQIIEDVDCGEVGFKQTKWSGTHHQR